MLERKHTGGETNCAEKSRNHPPENTTLKPSPLCTSHQKLQPCPPVQYVRGGDLHLTLPKFCPPINTSKRTIILSVALKPLLCAMKNSSTTPRPLWMVSDSRKRAYIRLRGSLKLTSNVFVSVMLPPSELVICTLPNMTYGVRRVYFLHVVCLTPKISLVRCLGAHIFSLIIISEHGDVPDRGGGAADRGRSDNKCPNCTRRTLQRGQHPARLVFLFETN